MTGDNATAPGPILIAGGGIGGLAVALALAQRGFATHVFEKRDDGHEEGAGIQLGPNGVKALCALGLDTALRPLVAQPEALIVHDGRSNRILTREPLNPSIAARFGAPYWTLHRADLHRALRNASASHANITLTFGCAVDAVTRTDIGARAQLCDGRTAAGRALIIADGLWSSLRRTIVSDAAVVPAGRIAFRTVVPRAGLAGGFESNAIHVWFAPRSHAVMYPVRGGEEIAMVLIAPGDDTDASWGRNAVRASVSAAVAPFHATLREIAETSHDWRCWPLFTLPPLQTWTNGCVGLLGDAAHSTLPFLAQGAVMALEDAIVLAKCFERFPQRAVDALSVYEATRLRRTQRVTAAAARNGKIYHLSGAAALARNTVLRMMPAGRLIASYDWLYGADV